MNRRNRAAAGGSFDGMFFSAFRPASARLAAGVAASLIVAGLWLGGCASSDGPPRESRRQQRALQPPLGGSVALLNDSLTIHARLGPFLSQPPRDSDPNGGGENDGERPRRRSGGGFNMTGGGMSFGGGGGGGGPGGGGGGRPPGGGDGPGREGGPDGMGPGGARGRGGPGGPGAMGLPRQTLRLTFVNAGPAALDFRITELRSVLGNFAPRPEEMKLAPGASAELEPVSGDAGGNLESLEVIVSISRGVESVTQTIKLAPTGEQRTGPPSAREER